MNKVGDINYNSFGSKMEIVKYINSRNVDIYFEEYNWTLYNSRADIFYLGNIKCPYEPRHYNKGYIGEGKYNSKKYKNIYNSWHDMLRRCYDIEYHKKEPTYIGCAVCNEWLNFQNFAQWYEENYYEINGEAMALDKDVLIKGNKIYSPQTCVFVPRKINNLFRKTKGVVLSKKLNKYIAQCSVTKNNKKTTQYLGVFNTFEEAFLTYKKFKENYIKQVADEYKPYIPKELYDAMYRYEVEITD